MGFIFNPDGATLVDNGTTITLSYNGTKVFRVVKATGDLQVAGGFDSDTTL